MESKLKELHSDLLNTTIHYKNYKLLFLSQVYIAESCFGVYKTLNLVNIIKKFSLDNVLKYFMLKASYPFSKRRQTSNQIDYLFINEINNKAVTESLQLVTAKFVNENTATVFSDMRIGRLSTKNINVFEMLTFRILLIFIYDSVSFLFTLRRYRQEIRYISKKYEISSFLLVLNFIDSILLISTSHNFFSRISASKIILMSDVHKLSRIIALKAKTLNSFSYVIQHGATIGEEGYLPITGDKILVWGEASKKWFIENQQHADRIEIVGSARMDLVKYAPKEVTNFDTRELKKVLVVLSDILVESRYLEIVKEAFVELSIKDMEIIIKLHPGGSVDYSIIPEGIFDSSGLLYRILRFEDVKLLLAETDIVFVTNSTVGMEAIIFNKPIFQFKSDDLLNYRMSYEDFDCTHIFAKSQDICQVVLNPQTIFSKLGNYSSFVSHYFHKLDGNSSDRIKKFIISN